MNGVEITVDGDVYVGGIIREGFGRKQEDWPIEGPGRFLCREDSAVLDAPDNGCTVFHKEPLPANVLIRYMVKSIPPHRQNNFNLISHCAPRKSGWPIVRNGHFAGYHDCANYMVTFVGDWEQGDWEKAGNRRGRLRIRRNPGFRLEAEQVPDSVYERNYEVILVVEAGRLRYYLNGRCLEEWQDPEPLEGGLFGLRTYCTTAEYRGLLLVALR